MKSGPEAGRMGLPRKALDGDLRFLDPQVFARIANLELVARLIVEGFLIGLHKSPYHGISSEFSSYRKYAKGDPFRFIDWKVLAKTDRVYIKQFEENTNTRCYILLDASASMAFSGAGEAQNAKDEPGRTAVSKWIYGRALAAALAYLLVKQGDAVGMVLYREGPAEVIPARQGAIHLQEIHRALALAAPDRPTDTRQALAGVPERLARPGMILWIGDLLDETGKIIAALRDIRLRRQEMILFHLLTPEERSFPYRENIEFIDAETGRRLTAQGSDMAAPYRRALETHLEAIRLFCRQSEIDFIPMSTTDPLAGALQAFLHHRHRGR